MTGTPAAPVAAVVREFAARWTELRGRGGNGDFLCAPAGLWTALAAVAAGARGRTAGELRGVLGVAGPEAARAVTGVGEALAGTDGLGRATGVWSRVPVAEAFRRGLPGVRFGALGGAAGGALGAWVREATGGRVAGPPVELDGTEDLVLLDAFALRAVWAAAFDARETRPAPFTDADGVTRPVPTLHRRLPASAAWRVGETLVVEVPCAGERAPRVRFTLGPEGAAAGPAAAWAPAGDREPLPADAVDLALPRFALRERSDARPGLVALGAGTAFRREADFSGLSPVPLLISGVAQEALVEVAEEGVEAAAVTQVRMARSAARPRPPAVARIAFDRPFGVAVLDAAGELPLLAGRQAGCPAGP